MPLPKEKTKPKARLEDYTILLYGQPKIGKSTFCSQMDNPLFLATEAGLNALEVYQVAIPTWEVFLETCKEIAAGKHQFKTVIIDTIDMLYRACSEYIRRKNNIQHESDLDYGKGWQMVKDELTRALTKLSLLPYGLVLVSHAQMVEIKTRTAVITKAVPTIPGSARDIVLGMSDLVLYAESIMTDQGEKRVLRTKPSENWEAGDRTGRLPPVLEFSFDVFKKAWDTALGRTPQLKTVEGGKKDVAVN